MSILKPKLGLAELFVIALVALEVGSHLAVENFIPLVDIIVSHRVLESNSTVVHIVVSNLFVFYHVPNSNGVFSWGLGDSDRNFVSARSAPHILYECLLLLN